MLYLDLSIGDKLIIDNGRVIVTLDKNKGSNKARFGIDADKIVPIRLQSASHSPRLKGLKKHNI